MSKQLFRKKIAIGIALLSVLAVFGQSAAGITKIHTTKDEMNFCEISKSESTITISSVLNKLEGVSASIIYVDDNYNSSTPGWQDDHFDGIQDAIDASSNGDTIFVYSGTYNETQYIKIDKPIHLIGEDRESTFINGLPSKECVVMIEVNEVEISGFSIIGKRKIDNDLYTTDRGIWLRSERNLIYMNNISNCEYGVYANNLDLPNTPIRNNIICNNIISNCSRDGIHLCSSFDNCVNNNTIVNISCIGEKNAGVHLVDSASNQIVDNTIQCRNCIIIEGQNSQFDTVSTNELTAIMKTDEGNAVCIYLKNAGRRNFITANQLNKGSKDPNCYLTYMINTLCTTWLGNHYDGHPPDVPKIIWGWITVGITHRYPNLDHKPI